MVVKSEQLDVGAFQKLLRHNPILINGTVKTFFTIFYFPVTNTIWWKETNKGRLGVLICNIRDIEPNIFQQLRFIRRCENCLFIGGINGICCKDDFLTRRMLPAGIAVKIKG